MVELEQVSMSVKGDTFFHENEIPRSQKAKAKSHAWGPPTAGKNLGNGILKTLSASPNIESAREVYLGVCVS